MRASSCLFAILVALLLQPTAAVAATITTIVDFTATNFTSEAGTAPPVDPVVGSFTVTFDPSQFVFDATTITVNNLNINLGSPIAFNYNPEIAQLTIGGSTLGSGGYFWGTDDFILGAVLLDGSNFKAHSFSYTQIGFIDSYSASFTPVVPIPGSVYLMVTALGALGWLSWRRAGHATVKAATCP